MTSTKPSSAQTRFLAKCKTGPQYPPATNGRASVTAVSAWHRTAAVCERRGWVTVTRTGGGGYRADITEAGLAMTS